LNRQGAAWPQPISLDTRILGLLVFVPEKIKRNPPLNPAFRESGEAFERPYGAGCIQGGFFCVYRVFNNLLFEN
jgi:hypothetical protein